uniref:Uncharacterized protein n=1 Tax=Anguilla anguilla TaxID=7936 RepID=A0A0E9SK84_ANGAN
MKRMGMDFFFYQLTEVIRERGEQFPRRQKELIGHHRRRSIWQFVRLRSAQTHLQTFSG